MLSALQRRGCECAGAECGFSQLPRRRLPAGFTDADVCVTYADVWNVALVNSLAAAYLQVCVTYADVC
jgi:hypothetical protein